MAFPGTYPESSTPMPPIVDKNDLLLLIRKFTENKATPEEIAFLEKYYEALDHSGHDQYSLNEDELLFIKNEMKQHLFADLQPSKGKIRKIQSHFWLRIAATIAIIIAAGTVAYLTMGKGGTAKELASKTMAEAKEAVSYTRNIILPDGSTAILRQGSSIAFNHEFSSAQREVTLIGEGYFDIVFDDKRPFIIYTGKIKTTVLGTAFNIKAYPGEDNITVSVTRGKVKVEDREKLLAILTPDQQVVYEVKNAGFKQANINAAALVTDWASEEMVFESLPFEQIASILMKRYGVTIRFASEGLKDCPIRAAFSGTEKIKDVMDGLCVIRGCHYTITENGVIELYGEPCEK